MCDKLRKLWQHRASDPTAAILDFQPVKTSPQGSPPPDSLEFPVAVLVTVAGTQEPDAAMPAMDDTL